jgi:hypothetical protein
MPPAHGIRASRGTKSSRGRPGPGDSKSSVRGPERATSIVRIRASGPNGPPPWPIVRRSCCRHRKSAIIAGPAKDPVRRSSASDLPQGRDSSVSVRPRPSFSRGRSSAWAHLGRTAPSASRRAHHFSLAPAVISRGRRSVPPRGRRSVGARAEATRSVVGRCASVPNKPADTKAPESRGPGASASSFRTRARDYLSSRAIRLDVSQRLPPIFCTSA